MYVWFLPADYHFKFADHCDWWLKSSRSLALLLPQGLAKNLWLPLGYRHIIYMVWQWDQGTCKAREICLWDSPVDRSILVHGIRWCCPWKRDELQARSWYPDWLNILPCKLHEQCTSLGHSSQCKTCVQRPCIRRRIIKPSQLETIMACWDNLYEAIELNQALCLA